MNEIHNKINVIYASLSHRMNEIGNPVGTIFPMDKNYSSMQSAKMLLPMHYFPQFELATTLLIDAANLALATEGRWDLINSLHNSYLAPTEHPWTIWASERARNYGWLSYYAEQCGHNLLELFEAQGKSGRMVRKCTQQIRNLRECIPPHLTESAKKTPFPRLLPGANANVFGVKTYQVYARLYAEMFAVKNNEHIPFKYCGRMGDSNYSLLCNYVTASKAERKFIL